MSSGAPGTPDGGSADAGPAGSSPAGSSPAGSGPAGTAPTGSVLHDRLRRLAYVTLSPTLGRRRRARMADALASRCLAEVSGHQAARALLVRYTLHVGPRRTGISALSGGPRASDASDPSTRATERQLAAMMPATRAAYALRRLEGMDLAETTAVLRAAGVPDPDTALTLADRAALDPAAVRAIQVPVTAAAARPRMVTVAAIALVVGVAAPVIAVTAGGNDDAQTPVTQESSTDDDASPDKGTSDTSDKADKAADADKAAEKLKDAGAAEAPAAPPSTADLGIDVGEQDVARDLTRILRRLDDELAKQDPSGADAEQLRMLRAAVIAEQDRLTP